MDMPRMWRILTPSVAVVRGAGSWPAVTRLCEGIAVRSVFRTTLTALALALLPAQALAATLQPGSPSTAPETVAQAQAELPTPQPQKAGRPEAQALSASDSSCSKVLPQLKALAKSGKADQLAQQGKTKAACISSAAPHKPSAVRAAAVADDRTPLSLPDWCYDLSDGDGTWYFDRFHACAIETWIVDVRDIRTQELLGQLYYQADEYVYAQKDISTWGHQLSILLYDGWGQISGTTVKGDATCVGDCTLPASAIDFPEQPVTLSSMPWGEALPTTTATAAGATGTARTTIYYEFNNPSWAVGTGLFGIPVPMDVRCDNAVPGVSSVGCVFPDYAPTDVVSLSGSSPNYARHIRDAQASGLPGAYPDGQPLYRLTDATLRDRNGNTACPQFSSGGYPRPTGYSCDEYPFRSTWQGAYTGSLPQPQPYPGRTFDWCQITALPIGSTGPDGWSACMIPAAENSSAGSLLNVFYTDNRVIEKDAFRVWIVD